MALETQGIGVAVARHQLRRGVLVLLVALALAASLAGFFATRERGSTSHVPASHGAVASTATEPTYLEIGNQLPIRVGGQTAVSYRGAIGRSCQPQASYSCKPMLEPQP